MSRESADIGLQLQKLASQALQEQVRSNQRYVELQQRIAWGALNAEQV